MDNSRLRKGVVEEEEQEITFYMDFDTNVEEELLALESQLRITGLDENKPILEVGSQFFRGEWRDTVGTHVFIEEDLSQPQHDKVFSVPPNTTMKYSFQLDKVLHMSRIFLNEKNDDTDPTVDQEESYTPRLGKCSLENMEHLSSVKKDDGMEDIENLTVEETGSTEGLQSTKIEDTQSATINDTQSDTINVTQSDNTKDTQRTTQ